jgi:adenosine deaminase
MFASDLHLHLDGSLRGATLAGLSRGAGLVNAAVSDEEFLSGLRFRPRMSLASCLAGFRATLAVMQTFDSLRRVALELEQDRRSQGIGYAEVRFCPSLHTERGLSATDAMEAVLAGVREGSGPDAGRGWRAAGLVVVILEGMSSREAAALVELAAGFRNDGVVGIDLAGDEALFDAKAYAAPLRDAKSAGLGVTVHAGEGGDPSHVSDAVDKLGADRIGHGVSAVEDPRVLSMLAERGTLVEICLSSNVHTGAVRSLAEHPLTLLDDAGVRVALATDNTFFSDTTLDREYALAATEAGADRGLLERSVVASAAGAFLPADERSALEGAYREALSRGAAER